MMIKKIIRIILTISLIGLLAAATTYFIMDARQETATLDEQVLKEAPGKFVSLKYGLVHYRLEGPDTGRLVLLIPGGGISGCEIFDKVASEFHSNGFRTLTYDLYGRGYSPRITIDYTPELFQEQLNQLLDALSLKDTLYVVAMSMGAIIGTDFIVQHLNRVHKFVLIDPFLAGQFTPNLALRTPILADFLMTVYWYPRALESQRKEFVNQSVYEDYKVQAAYFMNFKGYKHTNYSTWFHTLNQNKITLLDQISSNKILLLYGEQDPFFPKDMVNLFQSQYPSLRSKSIPQTGHIPHYEEPALVSEEIFEFFH
jgi:pimeloyl-ACP methyl ester carboxylesterase